ADVINCTFSGNGFDDEHRGYVISIPERGSVTMTNCTISGNTGAVGCIWNGGTLTLTNCIVANDTVVANLGYPAIYNSPGLAELRIPPGTITGSHNLIEDGSGGLADTIKGDPLLAPLGNYGGPTMTMPLLPGSPAIDAGASGAGIPTTDQRGMS